MYTQLDLEVMHKKPKKKMSSHFYEFWSEEVHSKNYPKKKTLMFECYNLMDSMEWQGLFFEVDVQQSNSKILHLLPQVLIFCLLEEIISSIVSDTIELGQKTQGILGIK